MHFHIPPTAAESRMFSDAVIAAACVVKDLGKAFPKQDAFWSAYLADKYGPIACADLSSIDAFGCYNFDTDTIFLDCAIPNRMVGEVVRHEIAHRLCVGTDRYAHLNQSHFACYDWQTFHEMIAELVSIASHNAKFYECLVRLPDTE